MNKPKDLSRIQEKREKLHTQLEAHEELLKEIQDSNDRTCAILASANLDYRLKRLIEEFLVDDLYVVDTLMNSSLRAFKSRIDVAYCLGLISEVEHSDLIHIKDIRNDFAHQMHGLTFESQKIKDHCKKLRCSFYYSENQEEKIKDSTAREIFFDSFHMIDTWMDLRYRVYLKDNQAETSKKNQTNSIDSSFPPNPCRDKRRQIRPNPTELNC